MKIINLKDFKNGWIVGDFVPSIVKTKDVDVAILKISAGTKGDGHFHKESTEFNFIIQGSAQLEDKILYEGDCFVYEKSDKSTVYYPYDTVLLVIKTPSVKNDKFYD